VIPLFLSLKKHTFHRFRSTMTTTIERPKRGGIHPLYELYLGGSPLDSDYQPTEPDSFSYATQRRNVKTIASIERDLTTARDSTTTLKFDGKLEPVVGSTTEVGKERFLQLLERRVEEHGHETFCSRTSTMCRLKISPRNSFLG
jgi:hypothetical protein